MKPDGLWGQRSGLWFIPEVVSVVGDLPMTQVLEKGL